MNNLTSFQFVDVAQVRAFILAGNARFTIVSSQSGARFTYRVAQCGSRADEQV